MPTRRTSRPASRRTSRTLRSNARPIYLNRAQLRGLFDAFRERLREMAADDSSAFVKEGDVLYQGEVDIVDVAGAVKRIRVLFVAYIPGHGVIVPWLGIGRAGPAASGKYRALSKYAEISRRRRRDGGISDQVLMLPVGKVDGIAVVGFRIKPSGEDGRLRLDPRDRMSLSRAWATLLHEMTHARDVYRTGKKKSEYSQDLDSSTTKASKSRKSKGKRRSKLTEEKVLKRLEAVGELKARDYVKYFNRPHEIRAFAQNIFLSLRPKMLDYIRKMKHYGIVLPAGAYGRMMMATLSDISDWKKMEPHLTLKNRNLLLRMLVTALEDEGIIRIE
jgi:hypothetical protein